MVKIISFGLEQSLSRSFEPFICELARGVSWDEACYFWNGKIAEMFLRPKSDKSFS